MSHSNRNTSTEFFLIIKGIFRHFEKYPNSLSCRELVVRINTTFMYVHSAYGIKTGGGFGRSNVQNKFSEHFKLVRFEVLWLHSSLSATPRQPVFVNRQLWECCWSSHLTLNKIVKRCSPKTVRSLHSSKNGICENSRGSVFSFSPRLCRLTNSSVLRRRTGC